MKIYTKKGDDGTTGLLYGQRVRKDSSLPEAYGTVDEAQAALGMARAEGNAGGAAPGTAAELNTILLALERDLWVLMSEVATAPENHGKLTAGATKVDAPMVERLESLIDDLTARFEQPTEFVVPGETKLAAFLDVARTVVRRAERVCLSVAEPPSLVVPYLNRLSDLVWTMARWQEGHSVAVRNVT